MRKTFIVHVDDAPGVLNRVASLFRRRGFNIVSLTVGAAETPGVARMTLVIDTGDRTGHLVAANLTKLVNVSRIQDVSAMATVDRDLALIRVGARADARADVIKLADVFQARVVDVDVDSLVIEAVATEDKIDALIAVLEPYGVLEVARTGRVAMTRGRQPAAPVVTTQLEPDMAGSV